MVYEIGVRIQYLRYKNRKQKLRYKNYDTKIENKNRKQK